jgi:hypothetical protein
VALLHSALGADFGGSILGLSGAMIGGGIGSLIGTRLVAAIPHPASEAILRPDPDAANGHLIELYGEIGAILSLCGNGTGGHAKARTGSAGNRQLTMVAGTGLEHCLARYKAA